MVGINAHPYPYLKETVMSVDLQFYRFAIRFEDDSGCSIADGIVEARNKSGAVVAMVRLVEQDHAVTLDLEAETTRYVVVDF